MVFIVVCYITNGATIYEATFQAFVAVVVIVQLLTVAKSAAVHIPGLITPGGIGVDEPG